LLQQSGSANLKGARKYSYPRLTRLLAFMDHMLNLSLRLNVGLSGRTVSRIDICTLSFTDFSFTFTDMLETNIIITQNTLQNVANF
jgi:hypothetical protein